MGFPEPPLMGSSSALSQADDELVRALVARLEQLETEVAAIEPVNSIAALERVHWLARELRSLRPTYRPARAIVLGNRSFRGGFIQMTALIGRDTIEQLGAAMILRDRWADVHDGIVSARSEALAWLSAELGFLSLVIAILPLL